MYKRLYNFPDTTPAEDMRLQEIKFYMLVFKLLQNYKDPVIVVNLIDAVAQLSECNPQIISQIVLTSIKKDPAFAPRQKELVTLLYKCKIPIRKIATATGLSNERIYEAINKFIKDPIEILPKLNKTQHAQIVNFLNTTNNISKIFDIWR